MGGKKVFILLFMLLVFLNVFDVWSTVMIIGNDASMELNPLMRYFMFKFGVAEAPTVFKSLVLIGLALIIVKMQTQRDRRTVMGGLLVANSFSLGALTFVNLPMLLIVI